MEIEPLARMRGGTVVFEPKYRDKNALRGIEGFSHLWLIWGSEGGLELTVVAFDGLETKNGFGAALRVEDAGIPDGVSIYDVKPYIPYTDAHDM